MQPGAAQQTYHPQVDAMQLGSCYISRGPYRFNEQHQLTDKCMFACSLLTAMTTPLLSKHLPHHPPGCARNT
jgi:hypothetical protein